MGYCNLHASSPLQCQDTNCIQQFPNRPTLVPKMGSTGGSFGGRAFIVCDKVDIHTDRKAWFGAWATGVVPRRNTLYICTAPSRKQRERCAQANCKGYTANGCPYRLCASHCRLAGGCSKHKLPITILPIHVPVAPIPLQSGLGPSTSSSLDQFQSSGISEEDAVATALDTSKLDMLQKPTSYSSSSRNTVPVTAGSSSSASQPQSQSVVHRPTVTSQLGGAWLTVLNADDEDKVEKEKMAIAKAEAAAEAKKSVDVVWYDKDFATAGLFTFQGKKELPEYPCFNASRHLPRFGNNITSIQHYNAVRGGWVSVGLAYLFPIKENKPIVLRRDGVTQIPSFEKDWEHVNIPVAPADYHADMTGVRRSFRTDMVQKRKTSSAIVNRASACPSSLTSANPLSITPPAAESTDDSEIEVHGSPLLSPTNSRIPRHKRIMNHSPSNEHHSKRSRFVPHSSSPGWPSVGLVPPPMVRRSSTPFSSNEASSAMDDNTPAHTSSRTAGTPTYITSSSADESEVEVTGSPILSPTNTGMPHLMTCKQSHSHPTKYPQHMHFGPRVDSFSGSSALSSPSPSHSRLAKHSQHMLPMHFSTRVDSYNDSPVPSSSSSHSHLPTHSQHMSPMQFSPQVDSLSPDWPSIECRSSSYMGSSAPSSPSPSISSSSSRRQSHCQKKPSWHHGLYCEEFASGLECMDQSGLSQMDAFSEAFPGRLWVRRTFQDNKRQWLNIATPAAREEAIAAGRTPNGLWCRFSKRHPITKSGRT